MSGASVAVVVTSGECHEGKAGMVLFALKLCDPCLSALCAPWCKKALYKYSSFPLLFLSLDWVLSYWAHFTVLRFIFVYVFIACTVSYTHLTLPTNREV